MVYAFDRARTQYVTLRDLAELVADWRRVHDIPVNAEAKPATVGPYQPQDYDAWYPLDRVLRHKR